RLVIGGIDRDGRDEDVLADVALKHAGGVPHPNRQRGRIVNADVPSAVHQGFEVSVAVAEQFLHWAGPDLLLTAAVENRHVVPAGQRVADLMRADETGATQDQHAHWLRRRRVREGRKGEGGGRKGGELNEVSTAARHGAHSHPRGNGTEFRRKRTT